MLNCINIKKFFQLISWILKSNYRSNFLIFSFLVSSIACIQEKEKLKEIEHQQNQHQPLASSNATSVIILAVVLSVVIIGVIALSIKLW